MVIIEKLTADEFEKGMLSLVFMLFFFFLNYDHHELTLQHS